MFFRRRIDDIVANFFTYFILLAVLVITIYPLLWMIFGSLKSDAEFYTNIWSIPKNPIWENYLWAWVRGNLHVKFINSILITGGTLLLSLPLTALAAYAFARFKFPGSQFLFFYFLFGLMVPVGVIAIPIFTVIVSLGLVNTRISLILVFAAQSLGFGIFLMRAFFLSLPKELEEAALIDGCTQFGAFFRVILPLTKPGFATLIVFNGLNVWNEYFLSSLLIRSEDLMTLPLGVVNFIGQYLTYYPQMFATLAMSTLPIVILYIFAQKQFISGMTAGALKG